MSRIYIGDSREILPSLIEEYKERVALVVTSPPYFVNRGYEAYLKSETEYWDMIKDVFSKVAPLIEPWGKVAINYADRYANARDYGRPLELAYTPHYVRIMEELGFDLWARIIWDKVRVMIDGARHTTNKGRFTGSMRVAPNWEYIFVWRKQGEGKPPKKQIDMTKDEWKEWVNGIWRFSSVPRNANITGTKLAIFPEELPRRLIKSFTQPGDFILDPFAGTGTVIRVARGFGRVGIGVEKNPQMLESLMANLQSDMFSNDIVEFINV